MTRTGLILAAMSALCLSSAAQAGKLPASAVPLDADEVTKLHSGNTGVYPTVEEYFAPDGTTMGTFGRPAKSAFAGKWIAFGNTLCMLNGNRFEPKIYTDCNAFWKDGGKVYILWSTHSDGSKVDTVNGYYDLGAAMKPGNLVADRYKALSGM